MKKKKLILISFLSIICLTACIIIVSLCSKGDNNDYNEALIKPVEKLGYYNSDLFPIEKAEKPTKNVVELSTLYAIGDSGVVSVTSSYTNGFNTESVINISSEKDLYAFSYLCNEYVSNATYPFLAYSYQLTQNIDYSDCLYSFLPIGYTSDSGFSGVFNGNGYEIENLKFESITTTNQEKYNNIEYYAMFTLVAEGAQISNFGIINPFIDNLVKPDNLVGTAVIAGVNYGHIGYVFVKDLRDIEEDAGVNAAGQGRISLLVGKNGSSDNKVGSIENCYVAATIVVSFQNTEYLDFNELLVENYADISNLYYYNKSITKYAINGDTENVEYLGIGIAYNGRVKYGTRCGSEKELTETLLALTDATGVKHWKDETSYGVDSSTFDIATPITRGMNYDSKSKTFYVDDEMDFAYMFELMRESSYFASNQITYEIRSNIDLSLLNPDAYYYGKAIAATIKGKEGSYESVYFSDSTPSNYPTIFDPVFKNYALNEGVECYGVFPYLSGVVQDLNIAITSSSYSLSHVTTSSNTKTIGFVSGLIEGGLVNNVNVFASSVELNDNINRYYFGSIAGIISGGAAIQNVTASLSFNDGTQGSINSSIAYDKGIALGGIVGFIAKTYGNVYDALSCVNFNLNLNSACEVSVGGIIGSGYTRNYNGNKTSKLENRGSIVVNSGASATNLYASGIIAHQLGMQDEVTLFNNIGDITLNTTGSANTYVSGISNVDLASSSNLKERGIVKYAASGFTNASNINITSSRGNVYYAGVLNLNSTSFTSSIDNMYNLGYKAISGKNTYLDPQSIEMSAASTYAGVINNIGGSTNYKVNAEIVYNFRDIIIKNDSAVSSKELYYSAVMLGGNINYIDVRNEGNININLTSAFNNTNTLNVMGVFDTLSLGCSASEIYNGGNITITDKNSTTKNLNINVSGIARFNNAVIEDLEQNPLDSSFDNTLVGSLDKAINNGNILITSDNYDKDTVTANNSSLTNLNLVGSINASGIVSKNSGIISNVFNLGDITLDIYATTASNYNAGGIVCEQDGKYAQIRDTANNGELQLINMSLEAATLNAGGIVAKNDSTGSNINQIISFTINYGSVLVFNANDNMELASATIDGTNAMASGILGVGFCNTVNVVNYGNIYSSEAAGGMICIADLQAFDNSEANLANTLNYGNIYAIRKYFSDASAGGNLVYLTYNNIITLNSQYIFAGDQTIQKQYIGAIVSLIRYSSNSLNIRYLINFYQATAIVAKELNSPSQVIDTSNFITTRGSADTFGGGSIKYAPLSTISDELGNIGVFSDEFVFHQAINGIGLDESKVTDKYITDYFAFIRFDKINDTLLDKIGWRAIAYGDAATQFARNLSALSALLDKAGYNSSSSLISDAMNSRTWLSSCDSEIIKSIITESLASGELTEEDLKNILNYMLFDSESQTVITSSLRSNIITGIIEYYDLENTDYYILLQSLLYDELLAKIVAEEDANYKAILTKIQSIISTASDTELESVLNDYINALLADDSNEILSPLFNEYNDYYLTKKMNLVNTLISGYSEDTLQKMYDSLSSGSSSTSADSLKYQMYLQEHPTDAVAIYSTLFTMNSTSNNEYYQEALNTMLAKYNIVDTIDNDDSFSINNMVDNNTALSGSAYINGTAQAYTKNYTELWNIIKNDKDLQAYISTNYFRSVKNPTDGLNYYAIIAKATEYNNTYQTQDAPATYEDSAKEGVYRTESTTGDIRNRFIYTPDLVNNIATYYYGPFNYDGSIWNNSTMSGKNPPYNQGYDIYANQAVSGTTKTYFPFFIATNEKTTENQIAKSNTTSSFGYKPFVWNDVGKSGGTSDKASAGQWVSDYILQKRADDVTAVLYKNYNSGEYIVDYYDYSPNKIYHQTGNNSSTVISETATTNYSPIDGSNITLTENNKYKHGTTSTGNPYESDFLKGYATSDIITGIWCMFDLWYSGGAIGAYITSKDNGDNADGGYSGIHTTLYTYYQIADLVKLDGVRTKGKNTGTSDTDEISIISALMTKILSTNAGKRVVLRALASYSASNSISNINIANMLTSAIRGTDVAGETITDVFATLNSVSLNNIAYSNTQTLKQYFDSLIQNVEYTTAQNIALLASSDIESFKKLLEIVFTNIPDNNSGNTISSKDTRYFLYNYYLELKESGLSDAEILSAINSADSQDLVAFEELSNTDFSYQITSEQLDDLASEYNLFKFNITHNDSISVNGSASGDYGTSQGTSTWNIANDTNINITGDGDIYNYELYGVDSITTGALSPYYVLELEFSGGTIVIDGVSKTSSGSQWILDGNTDYQITTNNTNPNITSAKLYNKNEFTLEEDGTVRATFRGTVTINGVVKTNNTLATSSWTLTEGTYTVTVSTGTTFNELSLPDGTTFELENLNVSNGYEEINLYEEINIGSLYSYAVLSEIENSYNTYYEALSDVGSYIAANLINQAYSNSSVTIYDSSIVLVKSSNSTGTIIINGVTKDATGGYVAFYLPEAGAYNITGTASISNVLIINRDDYLSVQNNSTIILNNTDILYSGTNYTYLSNFNLQIATHRSDMIAAIDVLFPSMFNDSNLYDSNKEYYIFDNDIIYGFTNDELKSIIILLAQASYEDETSILGRLINNLASEYYDDIILEYEELAQYAVNKIWDIAEANEASYEDITKLLLAAYIGDDYLDCDNKLLSSKIYSILNGYSSGNYQYIISNTTVDSDKFIELIIHLGITSNIDGFGIYALSASTGIKDGIFIPDNFDLTEMDAKYDITSNGIILSDSEQADWREKNSVSSEASSVNNAFDEEMKQLKKSIATTIFTLNLGAKDLSGNSLVLYSSPELIDLDNHVITYYIPKNLSLSTSLTINKLSMANKATANKQVGSVIVFALSNNTYTLTNAIEVTAEDENEVASYTIIIEKVDMSFSLTPQQSTVADGKLELNVTSPKNGGVGKLPANLDLTPFITIQDSSSNVVDLYDAMDDCYTYFELSMEDDDHIIDQNGSAVITMYILDTLQAGTYTLTLSIYGMIETVIFIKPENVGNSITNVQFDGKQIELLAGQTVTSHVPFGIAYDDTDLEDYLYLDYEPTISPGATVSIAVSKGDVENSQTIYYEIIYTITSESGATAVYTHRLQELEPFSVGNSYVDLFKDGASEGTYTYLASSNQITASYSRDEGTPTYRVKFIMDNFFYGDTTSFTHTPQTEVGVAVDSALSEGISVTISQNAESKTYSYSYVYDSYGSWNGEEYHRTYVFPALKITKEASKDASLSKLTFLDDYSRLSGANTVVNPNYAMLPENPNDEDNPYKNDNIGANEYYYETVKSETPKKITVGSNTINYASSGNDYNTYDTSSDYYTNHFYALGIVSNTELGYYAPTFAIEEHAQIYQYITQAIIENYGAGQTLTDTEILNNMDSIIYIYVPFVKETEKNNPIESKNITTLLVKLNNGVWQEVYEPSFYIDGTDSLGNMNGSKDTKIIINGESYVVDSSAGKPTENQSLNMDYIGTPKVNHFWYVSYIVLSESYLTDENIGTENFDNPYYKSYHISIIDQSNNVFYEVSIKAPETFKAESLYLNINVNKYDEKEVFTESQQISAYANKDEETKYAGYSSYSLERSLQILPSGYYYFYIALPEGYSAKYKISKDNTNQNENEVGAYLPPSSIVTQRIELEIEIYANDESDGTVWGVSTQTNYIRLITAVED